MPSPMAHTLGCLRVFQATDAELIGVALARQPGPISTTIPFAIVRGSDERRPRRRNDQYRERG